MPIVAALKHCGWQGGCWRSLSKRELLHPLHEGGVPNLRFQMLGAPMMANRTAVPPQNKKKKLGAEKNVLCRCRIAQRSSAEIPTSENYFTEGKASMAICGNLWQCVAMCGTRGNMWQRGAQVREREASLSRTLRSALLQCAVADQQLRASRRLRSSGATSEAKSRLQSALYHCARISRSTSTFSFVVGLFAANLL